MSLNLYNTLSKKKELFKPLNPANIGMYTCGPTVYNYAHIGNLRTYIFEDLLKRALFFNGFKVKHVMNITDVGHLTSDADTGEDKMLKGALREKKTVWEIAEFYTKAFQADLKRLNILEPTLWCKATEHIKEQIELIKRLEKKGFTYFAGGNVYFDTSKVDDYGKLAKLDLEKEGEARVEKDSQKRNPHDFVLWFTKSKFREQEMKWSSPWSKEGGYPGWHIECSAMSMKYLGEQFDLHCGGIDHIPVHHTNEIAQSESATGKKPWVKYWLHGEFLVIPSGEKMAKSGENFLTLSVLEERGFSPLDYRYFCLGTHYRKPLMFSWEALEGARKARQRLAEKILEFKAEKEKDETKETEKKWTEKNKTKSKLAETNTTLREKYSQQFRSQINDDLNLPQALATLWEVVKEEKLSTPEKYKLLLKFEALLGLELNKVQEEKVPPFPPEVLKLAEERELARQKKDWQKSDELREKIKALGYVIGDSKEGWKIMKK
jgi:cysteinyl-tRNA synthetase